MRTSHSQSDRSSSVTEFLYYSPNNQEKKIFPNCPCEDEERRTGGGSCSLGFLVYLCGNSVTTDLTSSMFPAGNFWCPAQRLEKHNTNALYICFDCILFLLLIVSQPARARAAASPFGLPVRAYHAGDAWHQGVIAKRWYPVLLVILYSNSNAMCPMAISRCCSPYLIYNYQGVDVSSYIPSISKQRRVDCKRSANVHRKKMTIKFLTSAPQQPLCSFALALSLASNRPFQVWLEFWVHFWAFYSIIIYLLSPSVSSAQRSAQLLEFSSPTSSRARQGEFLHRLFIQIANSLHRWLCIRLCGRRVAF